MRTLNRTAGPQQAPELGLSASRGLRESYLLLELPDESAGMNRNVSLVSDSLCGNLKVPAVHLQDHLCRTGSCHYGKPMSTIQDKCKSQKVLEKKEPT